jgi:putative tryptophan/tyrosine transport system substrate-binding protein
MQRREFFTLLGGAAAARPLAARGQQAERMRRIGALMPESEGDPESQARVAVFHRRLQELGWTVGRNLRIDYRWATGDLERTRVDAAELLRLGPDVILAVASPALATVQKATRTIPVVFVAVSEPVAQGFIQSLAHPGGNITGFTNLESTFGGKWLELLKEMAPRVTRVAIMFNPNTAPYAALFSRSVEAAAQKFGVEPAVATVQQLADVEAVMSMLARGPGGGLIVLPDPFTTAQGKLIGELAARFQLPAIYPFRFMLVDGGLASYGVNIADLFRQAASYVDRIFRGEKPADLPVQQPTKYELVINLKTAKALGLDVPLQLQQRADEVIE